MVTNQKIEKATDIGTSPEGIVKRWTLEIRAADDEESGFRDKAASVEKRYRDEERTGGHRFNILWSNTQILKAAIFSGDPKPDVRRRYRDRDDVARTAAQILERALEYTVDSQDFADVIQNTVHDYLLPGRGVARIRYLFDSEKTSPVRVDISEEEADEDLGEDTDIMRDEDGLFFFEEGEERITRESVIAEYVPWDDYRQSPAKMWQDVRWVAFRTYMTRDELTDQFGEVGKQTDLVEDWPDDANQSVYGREGEPDELIFNRALVWEIWDRDSKEMIVISPGSLVPLYKGEAPLQLKGFFPCPKPMISIRSNRTLVPVPEFVMWQDQADELDRMTSRIDRLVDAMKVRGVYPSHIKDDLSKVLKGSDNDLIPVDDFETLAERGGFEGIIAWIPIEPITNALQVLIAQRANLIQSIFEITGVSDVFRGATDPRETYGAQRLKTQFGSLRLKPRQEEASRFVRDLFRLMSEVIAEEFSPQTMMRMTGTDLTMDAAEAEAEKLKATQIPQMGPGGEMMPPPPIQPKKPEMEEVINLLRDDGERGFRIDVETDSTVAQDEGQGKSDAAEFITAIGNFFNATFPMVQTGAIKPDAMGAILSFGARRFKAGRSLEDIFNEIGQPPPLGQQPVGGQQEDPEDAETKAKIAEAAQKAAADQSKAQTDVAIAAEKIKLEREKIAMDREKMEGEFAIKRAELEIKAAESVSRAATV